MSIYIGILLFDEVDVLSLAGPYEVFTCASRLHAQQNSGQSPLFKVGTVAGGRYPVKTRAGLRVEPDFAFDSHPGFDCFIVPGGIMDAELNKPELMTLLQRVGRRARVVASVCSGAYLLARSRLITAQRVTTHREDVEILRCAHPALDVRTGVPWVDSGFVVTSSGSGSGIDMCLHLVERLHSRELALRTARRMEYQWAGDVDQNESLRAHAAAI